MKQIKLLCVLAALLTAACSAETPSQANTRSGPVELEANATAVRDAERIFTINPSPWDAVSSGATICERRERLDEMKKILDQADRQDSNPFRLTWDRIGRDKEKTWRQTYRDQAKVYAAMLSEVLREDPATREAMDAMSQCNKPSPLKFVETAVVATELEKILKEAKLSPDDVGFNRVTLDEWILQDYKRRLDSLRRRMSILDQAPYLDRPLPREAHEFRQLVREAMGQRRFTAGQLELTPEEIALIERR